jgi:hypothetical protein
LHCKSSAAGNSLGVCLRAFFAAAVVWRWLKDGVVAAGRLLLGLGVSATIAFGLAAVAFLPMTPATGATIRHLGSNSHFIGHASIPASLSHTKCD